MQLFTPWFADTVPSDLTLFIGLRNDKVSNYPKYLPNVVADSLKKFLADAKGEGELRNGAFIYRGGLKASLDKTYTTQLALDLEDVSLNYMEGWAALEQGEYPARSRRTFFTCYRGCWPKHGFGLK